VSEHGWLAVGGYDLRSACRRPDRWQLTLLECPATALIPRVGDAQLYRLDLRGWPAVRSVLLDQDGVVLERATARPAELLGHGSNAALGLLRAVGPDRQLYLHIDSFAGQARFLRLPGRPVPAGIAIGELLAGLDRHSAKVSNHLGFRVELHPGVELAQRFSLAGSPDVYALARDTLALAGAGGLPGWLVEFREELRSWDLLNQVDAIQAPPAEAGYVSITRHEVSVESIETGNVFVISFERSTIVDGAGVALPGRPELRQCQLEYRYSQSLGPVSQHSVRRDLATLHGLLAGYVGQQAAA
jgi:hypothetical protein